MLVANLPCNNLKYTAKIVDRCVDGCTVIGFLFVDSCHQSSPANRPSTVNLFCCLGFPHGDTSLLWNELGAVIESIEMTATQRNLPDTSVNI